MEMQTGHGAALRGSLDHTFRLKMTSVALNSEAMLHVSGGESILFAVI